MRISDWSSDVCSSDLDARPSRDARREPSGRAAHQPRRPRRRRRAQYLEALARRGRTTVRRDRRRARPALHRPLFHGRRPHHRLDRQMLRTLAAQSDAFPLARPFRISRGVKTVADVVTVEIGHDGLTGRGEGVPYPRYGESIAGALAAIEAARGAIAAGAQREEDRKSVVVGKGVALRVNHCGGRLLKKTNKI